MLKHINVFNTESEYNKFKNSTEFILPNISVIKNNNNVFLSKAIIDYSTQYFTIESLEDENQISFTNDIEFSTDESTWDTLTSGESLLLNSGDEVKFKLNNPNVDTYGFGTFSATKQYNVKGNVMSLLHGDEFIGENDLSSFGESILGELFRGSTTLIDASNLILPATTLTNHCYYGMFSGCTSLTTAPELPATILAQNCYKNMFQDCTSLTTAPKLPATTLMIACYSSMFCGCTSLTTAPELPATILAHSCYHHMFSGCTSLNNITMLATDISASGCLSNWVSGVLTTGTFTKSSMTSLPTGVDGIPEGWTVKNYGETNDPYNGHEYVDLGLPSGTKWAKCNVGANSETEAGLYFAWGETTGYTADDVRNGVHGFYQGTGYTWGTDEPYGFNRYNDTDGLTVLLPEHDAAHVNMGGDWRMPTKEDFDELTTNTASVWTTVNGVSGRTFTSYINGNVLFIPAAGYCDSASVNNVGSNGYVWSSSLYQDNIMSASSFNLYSSSSAHNDARYTGESVRGVVG